MHTTNILQILNYSNPSNLYGIDESRISVFKKNYKLGVIKIMRNAIHAPPKEKKYITFLPQKISLICEIFPEYFDPNFYVEFENERRKFLRTEISGIQNLTLIKSLSLIPKEIINEDKIIFDEIQNNFKILFKKEFTHVKQGSVLKIKVNESEMTLEDPPLQKIYPIWTLGTKYNSEISLEEIESTYFTLKAGIKNQTAYSIINFKDIKNLLEKLKKHKLEIMVMNEKVSKKTKEENKILLVEKSIKDEPHLQKTFEQNEVIKSNFENNERNELKNEYEKKLSNNFRKNYWNLYEDIVNGKINFTIKHNNEEYKFISRNGKKINFKNNLIRIDYEMVN